MPGHFLLQEKKKKHATLRQSGKGEVPPRVGCLARWFEDLNRFVAPNLQTTRLQVPPGGKLRALEPGVLILTALGQSRQLGVFPSTCYLAGDFDSG